MSGARRVAAFFDIDHTVLEINSGSKWIAYLWRTGKMSPWQLAQAMTWLVQYRFSLLDFEAMTRKVLGSYTGKEVEPIEQEVEAWFRDEVAWAICSEAWQRVEEHRRAGHEIALLTSATRFLSNPVARALQVEHILCTEVEIVDGVLTGRHIEPLCYGPGKVLRAEQFAAERGIELARSYFYTDSFSDLPMLERVGEPRVINPDPRLRRRAADLGWPIETWKAHAAPPSRRRESEGQHVGSGSR